MEKTIRELTQCCVFKVPQYIYRIDIQNRKKILFFPDKRQAIGTG